MTLFRSVTFILGVIFLITSLNLFGCLQNNQKEVSKTESTENKEISAYLTAYNIDDDGNFHIFTNDNKKVTKNGFGVWPQKVFFVYDNAIEVPKAIIFNQENSYAIYYKLIFRDVKQMKEYCISIR